METAWIIAIIYRAALSALLCAGLSQGESMSGRRVDTRLWLLALLLPETLLAFNAWLCGKLRDSAKARQALRDTLDKEQP